MAFRVSTAQIDDLQKHRNQIWLNDHVAELCDLAPELVVTIPDSEMRSLVSRMLNRAEAFGVHPRNATIAFCYASLKLGVGFEYFPEHPWMRKVAEASPATQAELIWNGLAQAIAPDAEEI